MLDGAALGTLMIGLGHVHKDSEWSKPPVRRSARRSRSSTFRARLAVALRYAADRLDRRPSPALESSSSAA